MNNWNSYNQLIIDGKLYQKDELITLSNTVLNSDKKDWEKDVFSFVLEWLNDDDFITAFTSGSTGKPKEIKLQKSALIFSSKNTLNYLNLKEKYSTLLCIPAKYIGGKMMIARSFVGKLNLILSEPKSTPFSGLNQFVNFTAITPYQAEKSSAEELAKIKQIIIGGGNVSYLLSSKLKIINSSFYSTYGMTETCSHIALKNISKGNNYFDVLSEVSISKDDRDCLLIDAPKLSSETINTNDIIELVSESKFIWKGRFDNVINSGGIKLQPEVIEAKISTLIPTRFFITKEDDDAFGERLILIIESEQEIELNSLHKLLSKYEIPKHIYYTSKFIETESGKIHRRKTLEHIKRG